MWPEIELAKSTNRHELILIGNQINKQLEENRNELDPNLFDLINLNYLDIHETIIKNLSEKIEKLSNLQTLVLHSNQLEELNEAISKLTKLKILDLSRNQLKQLPNGLTNLTQLVSLIVSTNCLENFPKLNGLSKLTVLDLSNNKLTNFPDICSKDLTNLAELKLNGNSIGIIPGEISILPQLKSLNLTGNQIQIVPGDLVDCPKLKELNLKKNPIKDRRLLKLIDQCRTKQILDYVKLNCPKVIVKDTTKSGNRELNDDSNNENLENERIFKFNITINKYDPDFKVILTNDVKNVREHFVACLITNIQFDETNFKKFIQLQNKLHENVCGKRNLATIATHDFNKLPAGPLTYTTLPPSDLQIQPLNHSKSMTGSELFSKLQNEANNLRKEKKRNTYSGIHKYLKLIEGRPQYPCLLNSNKEVISFPPITNSDITKIELKTTSILIEVTSSTTQQICKIVLDTLIKDSVLLFEKDLFVKQVKTVDLQDNLKVVYPSKTDLKFDSNVDIKVLRD